MPKVENDELEIILKNFGLLNLKEKMTEVHATPSLLWEYNDKELKDMKLTLMEIGQYKHARRLRYGKKDVLLNEFEHRGEARDNFETILKYYQIPHLGERLKDLNYDTSILWDLEEPMLAEANWTSHEIKSYQKAQQNFMESPEKLAEWLKGKLGTYLL